MARLIVTVSLGRFEMPDYKAPLRDMRFVLNEVLDMDGHYQGLGLEEINSELLNAFLEEGAKFSENELAPRRCLLAPFMLGQHEC